MNKTVYSLVVGLLVVSLSARAMEQTAEGVVHEVTSEVAQVVQTAEKQVPAACRLCSVKQTCQKTLALCKRHPLLLAAGIALVAAVIVYNVVPVVQQNVDAFFGVDSIKPIEIESGEITTHFLPQEKIDVSAPGQP